MADNHIKLFGEELNTYPNHTDVTKGIGFDDSTWDAASDGYSTVRKSGFIPNSPVSSIALNTALKQASVGAKIVGDIIANQNIGNMNISTDDLNNSSTGVNALSTKLVDYLSNIHKLLTGDVSAGMAKFALPGSTLDKALTDLSDTIEDYYDKMYTGETIINRARYYADGGNKTIATKFSEIDTALNNLGHIDSNINITFQSSNVNYNISNTAISREGNIVYGENINIDFINPISLYNIGFSFELGTLPINYKPLSATYGAVGAFFRHNAYSNTFIWIGGTFTISSNGNIAVTIYPGFFQDDIRDYYRMEQIRFSFGFKAPRRT